MIIMATLIASLGCFSTQAQDCTITPIEELRLLSLSYHEFDQSLGGGWRVYGDQDCYDLSAYLLDSYQDNYPILHKDTLLDWQSRVMSWHAGQMFAFNNKYELAKNRFQDSYNPKEAADTPLLWNDYVSATLAFLEQDFSKLQRHRDRIANGPLFQGKKGNLDVVNGFLKCFGAPYSFAYSSAECRN